MFFCEFCEISKRKHLRWLFLSLSCWIDSRPNSLWTFSLEVFNMVTMTAWETLHWNYSFFWWKTKLYVWSCIIGKPEFLDSGRKSWTLDSGRWILDSGRWILEAGPWTLDAGLWTLDSGLWTLDSERWTLEAGPWTLDAGLWTLDSEPWKLDYGHWTLDAGRWMLSSGRWTLESWRWTLSSGHWILSLTVLEQNQQPVSDSAWLNYWKFFQCESLRASWSHLLYRDYRFWLGYF